MITGNPRYPIGQQNFAGIIEDGAVYIDKTDLIFNLVTTKKYVFISRPRRFGKSLLLSTIRYYFEGRKDLFEGLRIMQLEKQWHSHPVFHLSLGSINASDPSGLTSSLDQQLSVWERTYGFSPSDWSLSARFGNLIRLAAEKTGSRVVILIDEYDNPLVNTLDRREIHEANRELLKSIYSNLKEMDEFIRFAMITGNTRFSNTSIFSGLNNIEDITFYEEYSTICGFTEPEIKEFLWTGVASLAQKENCSPEKALALLKQEYDGYHFSEDLTDTYNPFSLLNCLSRKKIDNYWINSGVPGFLVKKLDESHESFSEIFKPRVDQLSLSTLDTAFDSPVTLLFQTGYLTIKDYDKTTRNYLLGIPNREVDTGLFHFMLGSYLPKARMSGFNTIRLMSESLLEGKPDEFLERLQSLLAPVSYQMKGKLRELDFERTLFVVMHILGFHVHAEMATSHGRIDLIVETKDFIYLMELKVDRSPEEALRQIDEKGYALPWKFDGRKIFRIGVTISSKERNISSWLIN